ncbi:hypothetical protein A9P79_05315 [Cupriavidus taiwanensis]|uniref:hypothetical protein n=1 Tax=Cupriavidus taiwanensis TaxID=164546 RepID=UPI001F02D8A8|nr:hypothetical protein [Cupriavidus taiwanensis]ULX51365.1 hypothetical protein A9P79_05315 [Cupriavidus taiwanensis]
MAHIMASMPDSAVYLHLAAVVLLLLGLAAFRAVAYVMASPHGRLARARRMLLVSAGRVLAVGAIWTAIAYGHGVTERAGAHNCRRVPTVDAAARYAAEYCYLGGERILLRIYGAERGQVLAHRTFTSTGPVRLSWDGHAVVFDPAAPGRKGRLALPPALHDRLLARLP